MKKLGLVFLALVLALSPVPAAAAGPVKIGLTQIVEHPSLDEVRQGFVHGLAQAGYRDGERVALDVQIAQGNMATANLIAKKFVGDKVGLILAISTPSAQACANATRDIPILFSAVTDPVRAGLVRSLQAPGGNVTGMTDLSPVGQQVALIREVLPEAKTIGTIYNAGEANSVTLANILHAEAGEQGFQVIPRTVTNSSAVYLAAKTLAPKVDAFYIMTDNTVASAFQSVTKAAHSLQVPLFAAFTDAVPQGAAAALAIDYYQMGLQTAQMAVRVISGENPAQMPVEKLKKLALHLNLKAAAAQGLKLPEAVLKRADKVLD